MEQFPRRLLVLGGGPAGVELAQAFSRLGSHVSVIEIEQQLLPSEDEDIADLLEKRLSAEGVDVYTGTTPQKVEGTDSMVRLTVSRTVGEAQPWTIEGDALLVAVGRAPNTEELDLEVMKIPFFSRGIPTYPNTRTGARGIYACGDVNGMFPYAHIAEYEAETAVSNVLLKIYKKMDYSKIPWCTYTDPEIASIGFNEKKARAGGVEYRVHTAAFKEIDMAFVEGDPFGLIKVLTATNGAVLGCQIIGSRAGELIHEWAAVVNGRAKIADMAGWVHVYPTLAGITKKVVDSMDSTRFNKGRTQKFLRFLLGLRGKR
jgi:pyruvate/2-oxoglutarate dehydrogenase complex dihydrolipoamide dehydrogenase (E3) component